MAKIVILEDNQDMTIEHYREILGNLPQAQMPNGCYLHLSGVSPDGHLRVISVWDSLEVADAFHEQELNEHRSDEHTEKVLRQVWDLEEFWARDHENHILKEER